MEQRHGIANHNQLNRRCSKFSWRKEHILEYLEVVIIYAEGFRPYMILI